MVGADAVVASDWHLGSHLCQHEQILSFLEWAGEVRPKRFILLGDIFESTHIKLNKDDWKIIKKISKLANYIEIIYCFGNHDCDADVVAELLGISFKSEYFFESGLQRIICLHGDIFDKFLISNTWTVAVADYIYLLLQRINPKWAVNAKRNSKTFIRCAEKVRDGAIKYAQNQGFHKVICGHQHHEEMYNNIYFNTGCWTEPDCHYAIVVNGKVEVLKFEKGKNEHSKEKV